MDTSEIFIKQCNCEEIQKQSPITDEIKYHLNWIQQKDVSFKVFHSSNVFTIDGIWLPTQAQLQAMLCGTGIIAGGMIDGVLAKFVEEMFEFFDEHMVNPIYSYCTSMEQLWLAFCQKELFNKIWNGENWVEQSIK